MEFLQVLAATYNDCKQYQIPGQIINIVSTLITVIKFGVPILLIIFGMLDLGKAVVASKEDEIKKGQQMFIKRVIAAILVFFVIVVVQLVVNLATSDSDTDSDSLWRDCIAPFVNGVNCNSSTNSCSRK